MATLENFRPGPALDFSAITNPLRIARAEEIAQQRAAIDEEIRRGTLSVAEGNLALKQLEAQTASAQTQQLGGLQDQLSNLTGGDTGVQPQTVPQGGLDELITSQLGGVAQGQDVVPSAPQVTAPAPVQRQPARVLTPDQISKATKIFNRMERVKPGSSQGFRDVLKFGNDQQIAEVERERKKQRGRAFQLKNADTFQKKRRLLGNMRAQDEADRLDVSEIERMQRMDEDALNIEIDSDLFMDKNIDEALKIAAKPPDKLAIERKLDLAGITDPKLRSDIITQSLTKPATQITIDNRERGFKIPINFMLKDPNNPSLGVKPIPGGPSDRPGAETVGDLAMLEIAREAFTGVRELVFEKDEKGELDTKNPNRLNLFNAFTGTPGTEGQELATRMEFGIQAITRIETGAAMPPSEISNTRKRFEPQLTDSAKVVNIKLDMYESFINGTADLLNPSGDQTSRFKFLPQINDDKFNAEFNRRLNRTDKRKGQTPPQRRATDQPPAETQILRFDAQGNRL